MMRTACLFSASLALVDAGLPHGAAFRSVEPAIVGGEETEPGQYKYQTWHGGCGGILVAPTIIMNAGHCNGYVNWAEVNIHNVNDVPQGHRIDVVEQIPHPDYNGGTLDNDIMFVRLAEDATQYGAVPIDIDFGQVGLGAGDDLWVSGWGATSQGGSLSNVLKHVRVDYVPNEQCNQAYNGGITDNMLCGGVTGGGSDACQGDSGGPIVVSKKNGAPYDEYNYVEADAPTRTVVGVVSWGIGCAQAQYPGVYARVSALWEWFCETNANNVNKDQYLADKCAAGMGPTVSPTEAPTMAPTISAAPTTEAFGSQVDIKINILTDNYGSETGFSLVDSDTGTTLLQKPSGSYGNNQQYVEEVRVYPSSAGSTRYTFTITDTYGDGICCGYGQGAYSITSDDATITPAVSGGEFSNEETLQFDVVPSNGDAPTAAPTASPGPSPPLTAEKWEDHGEPPMEANSGESKGQLNKRCMARCDALDSCVGHQYMKKCNGAGSPKCCVFKAAADSDFLNVGGKYYVDRGEADTRRKLEDESWISWKTDDAELLDFRYKQPLPRQLPKEAAAADGRREQAAQSELAARIAEKDAVKAQRAKESRKLLFN